MANKIRIKRRAAGGAAGAPASLENAELAYNEQDNILYYGYGTGGAGGTATQCIAIAGPGFAAPVNSPNFTGTPTAPTAAVNTNTTQIATTAFVLAQGNTVAGTITMNGTQSAGTSNLYAKADHVHPTDTSRAPLNSPTFTGVPAAPTASAGTNTTQIATTAFVATSFAPINSPTFTGTPAAPTAANGTNTTQIATTAYVMAQRLDQHAVPTTSVNLNSQKIINLATPTLDTDAATKLYVDSVVQGLDVKGSSRCATTANITLSGLQTIDGITVIANDRVLVKNQTTPAQNGIYTASAGAWVRATDMDVWTEVPAAFTFIEQGTTQAETGWVCTSDPGGTINTTAITFTQFSGAGTYLAGNGLSLTGNTFAVVADGTSLSVSGSGVRINATYPGQNTITTLGTVTTGVWQATDVEVAHGGTGVSTLTGLAKGNGTSPFTAAVAGTDYLDPNSTIDGGTF